MISFGIIAATALRRHREDYLEHVLDGTGDEPPAGKPARGLEAAEEAGFDDEGTQAWSPGLGLTSIPQMTPPMPPPGTRRLAQA